MNESKMAMLMIMIVTMMIERWMIASHKGDRQAKIRIIVHPLYIEITLLVVEYHEAAIMAIIIDIIVLANVGESSELFY